MGLGVNDYSPFDRLEGASEDSDGCKVVHDVSDVHAAVSPAEFTIGMLL